MVAEAFTLRPPDSRMVALNPAGKMFIGPSGVSICPAAGTDFWRQTWFGHDADNGHALLSEFRGDAELCACVHFRPRHCYDQAGLMVRLSADDWIKFCAEREPDNAIWLSVAATRAGLSDWSGMEWPGGADPAAIFQNQSAPGGAGAVGRRIGRLSAGSADLPLSRWSCAVAVGRLRRLSR